jgi:hypothetical protein
MTPKEYEEAVLERFKTASPLPQFVVRHNVRLRGQSSQDLEVSGPRRSPFRNHEPRQRDEKGGAARVGWQLNVRMQKLFSRLAVKMRLCYRKSH